MSGEIKNTAQPGSKAVADAALNTGSVPDDSAHERARVALFLCAAHCQGGHSDAGKAAAEVLGVPFPLTMDALVKQARSEGLNPAALYPWLSGGWASKRYFSSAEMGAARAETERWFDEALAERAHDARRIGPSQVPGTSDSILQPTPMNTRGENNR